MPRIVGGGTDFAEAGFQAFELVSNPGVNWTGAIAANAVGNESITGLKANKISIVSIQIESVQNLDYDVLFWKANTFASTVLGSDVLIAQEFMNMTANGFQIAGANQFYMTLEGLAIQYEDTGAKNSDGSFTLNVSLRPRTAGGKAAGAAGSVIVKIRYVVRD